MAITFKTKSDFVDFANALTGKFAVRAQELVDAIRQYDQNLADLVQDERNCGLKLQEYIKSRFEPPK